MRIHQLLRGHAVPADARRRLMPRSCCQTVQVVAEDGLGTDFLRIEWNFMQLTITGGKGILTDPAQMADIETEVQCDRYDV
jgi:hypothetical protein|eukprot:COSAG01_NODE_2725_length_7180_cov_2.210705_6_plen_81_part_00